MKRFIWVKFAKEGIHCYPDAATNPKLATGNWDDVSFLANDHRHMFHYKVTIEVFHNDRDREFIQEKRFIERLFNNGDLQLNHRSCEMMADDLYEHLKVRYKDENRSITIEVSEDDENGCVTQYDPT